MYILKVLRCHDRKAGWGITRPCFDQNRFLNLIRVYYYYYHHQYYYHHYYEHTVSQSVSQSVELEHTIKYSCQVYNMYHTKQTSVFIVTPTYKQKKITATT